jgi:hypothetical protein
MLAKSSTFAALLALALLPAGCPFPLLDVAADVQAVCVTYTDVQVEGVPAIAGVHSVSQSFTVSDLGEITSLDKLDAQLTFVSAELHATSGISDFTFVQAANVMVASGDPTSTLPTVDVYDCTGDCAPTGSTMSVPAATEVDAAPYVHSGSVVIDVELSGNPPTTAWTMDVDVCFSAHLDYQASASI